MSLPLAHRHGALLLIAAVLFLFPVAASAARSWVQCPTWATAQSGMTNSPGAATMRQFKIDFPGCSGTLSGCVPPYDNPINYACGVTYTPGGPCPAAGYNSAPWYATFSGGPIVLNDSGNPPRAHCAAAAPEDGKNFGSCGKHERCMSPHPVRFGTGNKFLRETDLPRLPSGLEFTRSCAANHQMRVCLT